MHHKDATLPELAEDVDRLTRLAYPDATTEMLQVLACDQFVDSLTNEEVCLRIVQVALRKLCSVHWNSSCISWPADNEEGPEQFARRSWKQPPR